MLANCHEDSYGLQSMHKNLDHLVQQPISFPSIIWMAKTNWIICGHGYGQHRRWKMFFQIWGLWRVSPKNRLTTRLDLIVKIFAHKFFTFDTFPFVVTMNIWNVVKSHHTTIEALFIWNNKSLNPNLLYNMFICFLLCFCITWFFSIKCAMLVIMRCMQFQFLVTWTNIHVLS